jgi:tetratricopeptide (TPR) repeat protein
LARKGSDERLRSAGFGAGASLLAELGRIGEARKLLEEGAAGDAAAANYPGRARKLLAMGHLFVLTGQVERARALSLEASRQYRDTEILLRAGRLLAHAGFSPDARRMLELIQPGAEGRRSESAHAILSAALAAAGGRKQEALDGLAKADRLVAPIHARDFLADGFERLGNVDDSLRHFRRIADRPALVWFYSPDTYVPGLWTASLLHTAGLYLRAGRKVEARAALDQFLKIRQSADADHPETVAAQKLLSAF